MLLAHKGIFVVYLVLKDKNKPAPPYAISENQPFSAATHQEAAGTKFKVLKRKLHYCLTFIEEIEQQEH